MVKRWEQRRQGSHEYGGDAGRIQPTEVRADGSGGHFLDAAELAAIARGFGIRAPASFDTAAEATAAGLEHDHIVEGRRRAEEARERLSGHGPEDLG